MDEAVLPYGGCKVIPAREKTCTLVECYCMGIILMIINQLLSSYKIICY